MARCAAGSCRRSRLQPEEQAALEALLDALEIIYPSPATFEIALQLRQRRKLTLGDALIAATCIEHGFTLATHNTADFDWLNEINIIDPLGATR